MMELVDMLGLDFSSNFLIKGSTPFFGKNI